MSSRRELIPATAFMVAVLLLLTFTIRWKPEALPVAVPSPTPRPAVHTPTPPKVAVWIQGDIPGVVPADLENDLMRLRGLSFRHVVPAAMQSKAELKKYLAHDPDEAPIAEQYACLRVFGFIPPGFDLATFKLDLLTSQVGGYYDPATKKFNVVDQGMSPTWLSGLMMGSLLGFNPQAVVTIHEMDHALDDQYFDIHRMELGLRAAHSDDQELAMTSLFEGDASWLMFDYAMGTMVGGVNLRDLPEEQIQTIVDQGTQSTDSALSDLNGKPVPLIFRRTLVFPYLSGMRFIHHLLLQADDWSAVNQAWLIPPVSTQQILHPELYPRRLPLRVSWKAPLKAVAGWQPVCENTLGEYLLTVFMEQHLADPGWQLAAHWCGDRYRVYRRGDRLALVWDVVFDSPESAGTLSDRIRAIFGPHGRMQDRLGDLACRRVGAHLHVVYGSLKDPLGMAQVQPGRPRPLPATLPVLPIKPRADFANQDGEWFSPSQSLGLRVPPDWTADPTVSGALVLRLRDPNAQAGASIVLSVPTTDLSHDQGAAAWLSEPHKLRTWTETLQGLPILQVEYEGKDDETPMRLRYATVLYRSHTLILTVWWPAEQGDAGEAIADAIVHTLELTP